MSAQPGVSNRTIAPSIPRERGVKVDITSGPVLRAPKEMIPDLTNLEHGSVLFIDEIHRLPKPDEEFLYTAMEEYRIDIILGEGVNAAAGKLDELGDAGNLSGTQAEYAKLAGMLDSIKTLAGGM